MFRAVLSKVASSVPSRSVVGKHQRCLSTSAESSKNNFVQIVEVGPRDGLQNESSIITTEQKVELIHMLAKAGCSSIEAGAFVSPKWVPQMADSVNVLQQLSFPDKTVDNKPIISCLVPNSKGMEKAISTTDHQNQRRVVDEIAIFGSASEEFSQRNIACSIEESMQRFQEVVQVAKKENFRIRGYVSAVVACPYQGPIAPTQVAKVVEQMLDLGCYEISLGDTIGVGTPGTIRAMLDEVLTVAKPNQLAMHCHDTYGQALANILVGLDKGIYTVDSSVAGLGGCPYAKGASGNVASEDVVYMVEGMGLSTGIDLDTLVDAGDFICNVLNKDTQSKVARAMVAKLVNK